MPRNLFVVRDGLLGAARFPSLAHSREHVSVAEVLALLMCGAAGAVAVGVVKLSLGIPGHSIALAGLPMALGVSLAPRRLAGSVMSAGALSTAWMLTAAGAASYGSGSIVSLSLFGPMMDIALGWARRGWRVYAALLFSGVATNLLALGSRAATKLLGLDAGARPFDSWWLLALITYPLSGAVAGVVGALFWFRFSEQARRRRPA
jgi:hypothetical protein